MSQQIRILYFASLREQLKMDEEDLDLSDEVINMGQLRSLLEQRGAAWADTFAEDRPLMMSINQKMARASSTLSSGDEVAFFPPVTGG